MKKFSINSLSFVLLFIYGSHVTMAQELFNNGDLITILNDSLYVNGGIENLSNGLFTNQGSVFLSGDWTNNAINRAFSPGSTGKVIFTGSNQSIQGTNPTAFYNLILEGSGVKQLNGIDGYVNNSLNLNDRELATGTNTLFVINSSPAAISRTTGLVSSLNNGALSRNTSSYSAYLFPVGVTAKYRPAEITPITNSPSTFAIRMADIDAGSEGYNLSQKEYSIGIVNPSFYHQIRRDSGTSAATITIYYDPILDGNFTSMGHWQNQPQWEDLLASQTTGTNGLSGLNKQNWNDFSIPAFALITPNSECSSKIFIPNAFSPNGDGQNEKVFIRGIDCIEKLTTFKIFDRWGEKVFETNNLSTGWDGFLYGKAMNQGVYVYFVKAILVDGSSFTKDGHITLLR